MKRAIRILCSFVAVLLCASSVFSASAEGGFVPYHTYEYNEFDEPVETPAGYIPARMIDAASIGLSSPFNTITDLCCVDGMLYILDSGNSRIVVLDSELRLVAVHTAFGVASNAGQACREAFPEGTVSFVGAEGLAVAPDGRFYVADTMNGRVLCFSADRQLVSVITRPDHALNNTGAAFDPSKIAVDGKGRLYVATNSITLGLMVFESDGSFSHFFGANEVLSTTQALVKAFRKFFLSVAQAELVEQSTPVSILNMDLDAEGFCYTLSPYRDKNSKAAVSGLLRKLNYEGNDILDNTLVFGDTEEAETDKTHFSDVDIDQNGFINLLDQTRGRIFQYTDGGMLLAVFGANGDQNGCFSYASAIETTEKGILVADKKKGCVFLYTPTEYIDAVHRAVLKMDRNDLEGSREEWEQLLRMNSNSYLAYKGLGRIADQQGDYREAMQYFRLAYAQEEYALSYQQLRQERLEKDALWFLLGVVVLLGAAVFELRRLSRYLNARPAGQAYTRLESRCGMPVYLLRHPVDGAAQFKRRHIASLGVTATIVLLWLIASVTEYYATGFSFSIGRGIDFNMAVRVAVTVGVFCVFVLANWVISIVTDGSGAPRDIAAVTAYSLVPYIVSLFLKTALTNVLVPSEGVFIEIIMIIGLGWSGATLFLGLMTIHEFSVGKTVWSLLLTLLGMVIIVFLIILLYSLVRQLADFIMSVYKEFRFRS